ncbi:MAG: pectinesterase family protein [Janthinobacterium lividum]
MAQNGSGNFKTIQDAINAVRDLSQEKVIIHIKKGIYHEKLIIPSWKTNIALVGEDRENTIISNNNYSGQNCLQAKMLRVEWLTTHTLRTRFWFREGISPQKT